MAGSSSESSLSDSFDSDTAYISEDDDPNVFKIKRALQPASSRTFTTRELHHLIHDGVIDLNPPYQRDVVWPQAKQISLIDSIWHHYHVPPIVFVIQQDEDGEEVRICVDGKQRLTSIQKFIDGQIPYKDKDTKKNWWFTSPHSSRSTRPEIPDDWKETFAELPIKCEEYHNLTPESEREIFRRVQLGMTLTAAEKLQAISSPWTEWVSELEARHVSVEDGLSRVLQWDIARGRNFQNIVHLVYCCDGYPREERIPSAQNIEKWLSREDKPGQQFKSHITQVLQDLWLIATKAEYNDGFTKISQRIAPVEFMFIGVLLYALQASPMASKAKAIYTLRSTVRQEYTDVRNNSRLGRAMWDYISSLSVNPTSPLLSKNISSSSKTKANNKKRKLGQDSSDGEYRPQPVRNIGKAVTTRARA